jgi:hypothetical protein
LDLFIELAKEEEFKVKEILPFIELTKESIK